MKWHIHTIHEGHKDDKSKSFVQEEGKHNYKSESCSKWIFFSWKNPQTSKMLRHIHTIHKGTKDDKCKSCFSESQHMKRHSNNS